MSECPVRVHARVADRGGEAHSQQNKRCMRWRRWTHARLQTTHAETAVRQAESSTSLGVWELQQQFSYCAHDRQLWYQPCERCCAGGLVALTGKQASAHVDPQNVRVEAPLCTPHTVVSNQNT